MLGAIIGDIIGSRFEFNNTSDFNFELFTNRCNFTDDTICTIAIADALLSSRNYKGKLQEWCKRYPNPMGGYGGSFACWLRSNNPQPYNSYGNGSAMRVSPIAWYFDTLEEVQEEAQKTAIVTHNHPEGIKGAVATATAIFLARKYGKNSMLKAITEYYPTWVEPLLGQNRFDETCQGTMPIVFGIINKANSFEEAIRYAVAVGGDSDTIGAIVGSIAEAIWGVPSELHSIAMEYFPSEMKTIINKYYR